MSRRLQPIVAADLPRAARRSCLLIASALVWGLAASPATAQACDDDSRYALLEFWLGDWSMLDEDGGEIAVKRIRSAHRGCLIEERWSTPGGMSGSSFTYFDPGTGRWRQDRVDGRGVVAHLEGTAASGELALEGTTWSADGDGTALRLTLRATDGGDVEQVIAESENDGASWKEFRSLYVPLGEAEARAAARQTAAGDVDPPADEPREVRVLSRAASRAELDAGDRRQIPLTSPMTLEVEIGALDLFPEGAAWRTDETAEYICNRVTVRELAVARRSRRQQVEVEVFVTLHTGGRSRRTDVAIAIVDSEGSVVATGAIEKFKLGGQVASYNARTGLTRSAVIDLEQTEFDVLFASDARPRLRVTVTVAE